MRRAFTSTLILVASLLVALGCRSGGDLQKAETQSQFGVRMAKMNLWREAMFRFHRAVEIDPNDAQAHNNLAVALEANGDFDGAAKEYREAMRLDRSNEHIQRNYSRYVEFVQRSRKRDAEAAPPESTATAPADPTAADTTDRTVTTETADRTETETAGTPPESATAPKPPPTEPKPPMPKTNPPVTDTNPPAPSTAAPPQGGHH
jgi:Flp pilus assembly protein TadD